MPQDNPKAVNMAFTLDADIASWIKRTTMAQDINQSQLARKIFREAMAADSTSKLKRAKKGSK